MENKKIGVKTVIEGDFNARMGREGRKIQGIKGDKEEEENARCSKDEVLNRERKILVKFMEERG